jgi:hypothetical protein
LRSRAFLAVVGLSLAFAFQQRSTAMRIGQEQEKTKEQFALAELRLYDAYLAQARASRLSQRAGQRLKTLDILGEAARLLPRLGKGSGDLLTLRNEVIAALAMMDLRQDRPLPNFIPEPFEKAGAFGIAFDANVERYAWLNQLHRERHHRRPGTVLLLCRCLGGC